MKMTEKMRMEMMEAMKTMKRICKQIDSCNFGNDCPFDKYCEYENIWDGTRAIPADFEIEED